MIKPIKIKDDKIKEIKNSFKNSSLLTIPNILKKQNTINSKSIKKTEIINIYEDSFEDEADINHKVGIIEDDFEY